MNHKIDDLLVEILKQIRASQSTPSTPPGTGRQTSVSSSSAGTVLTSWLTQRVSTRRNSSVKDRKNSSSSSSNSPSSPQTSSAMTKTSGSGDDSPVSLGHRKSAAGGVSTSVDNESVCGDENSSTSCAPLSLGCLSAQSSSGGGGSGGGGGGLRAYVTGSVLARLRRVGSPLRSGRGRDGGRSETTKVVTT